MTKAELLDEIKRINGEIEGLKESKRRLAVELVEEIQCAKRALNEVSRLHRRHCSSKYRESYRKRIAESRLSSGDLINAEVNRILRYI
jgi:predicted nuclease with TOPRIM domain